MSACGKLSMHTGSLSTLHKILHVAAGIAIERLRCIDEIVPCCMLEQVAVHEYIQESRMKTEDSHYECWKLETGHVAVSRALSIVEKLALFPSSKSLPSQAGKSCYQYHKRKEIMGPHEQWWP